MREEFSNMKAKWDNEKASVEKVQKIKEEIEKINSEIAIAQRNYDLEKAAQLQYGTLPDLKKKLSEEEEKIKSQNYSLIHEKVTEEEISKIVSRWIRNFINGSWDRMKAC